MNMESLNKQVINFLNKMLTDDYNHLSKRYFNFTQNYGEIPYFRRSANGAKRRMDIVKKIIKKLNLDEPF